ncbi:hypothetical protein PROFUN_12609 [Planoprotostelium fungivorum]|uniref:Uncharacterized protein n=1 Tax=Planoprotostelium fungivorum TaxID=1890364 RepID=A0A2P6N735_9EUKA|nr:hypothetical protein PROFUN_12609 [Planoprotostelium fungivorum]
MNKPKNILGCVAKHTPPEGIREYVSRNPADFKDYLDEISAETKYLSNISRLVKKEWSRCKEQNQEFCRLQGMLQMKMWISKMSKLEVQRKT